ncbi:MAG: BglII/BstYI family type II restriction endonuclease, partial [Parvibaculum sp.]
MFEILRGRGFEIQSINHAEAIIGTDFPEAVVEIETALLHLSLPISEIVGSGGGETKMTQRLRRALADTKWPKHNFEIRKTVDGIVKESITHEIDHVRTFDNGTFALEIEWNNKDPFFDRDLENFKRLHAEGVISVASIITRGSTMQSEILARIEQFATDNGIKDFSDLERLEIDPTPKHRAAIRKAVENGASFDKAWAKRFTSS